jgi:hypothetical protein
MRISQLFLSAATICLLAAARVAAPAQREQVLHEQSFDKGIAGWQAFLGYWRLNDQQWHWSAEGGNSGGCLAHNAGLGVKKPERGAHDALTIYGAHPVWTDYSFEADAQCERGHFGLWLRAKMKASGRKDGRWVSGYLFMVDPRHKTARLWRHRQDGFDKSGRWMRSHFSNPVEVQTAKIGEIPKDKWVKLKITASGPHIECFIDGQRIIEAEDATYSNGSVGFAAYKADVRFDNVRVLAIPPARSEEGALAQ